VSIYRIFPDWSTDQDATWKYPEVHVHWSKPVSFRHEQGPMVRSKFCLLVVAADVVKIWQGEKSEEGTTGG